MYFFILLLMVASFLSGALADHYLEAKLSAFAAKLKKAEADLK